MKKGKCKLCLKEGVDLLSNSHIISDFFHKDLKENNKYNLTIFHEFRKDRKQHKKKPSGALYENNLLCENCDNIILADYENYLKKLLYEDKNKFVPLKINNVDYLRAENVKYEKLKLGLLSILWRSSISNLDFFKEINLANDQSEHIRVMLLNGIVGDVGVYPIIIYILNEKDEFKVVLNPKHIKYNEQDFFKFIINGYEFFFIVGNLNIDSAHKLFNHIPNPTGKIFMKLRDEYYIKNYVKNIIINLKKS